MLTGKGAWIWQLPPTEGGDPWAITSKAARAGLSHVTVKVADGLKPLHDGDLLRRMVRALHSQGIQVWAWSYVRGKSLSNAAAEGALLGQRAAGMGADGAVLDAEGEYESAGAAGWAKATCQAAGSAFPGPLALSSFWKPSVHGGFPWHTFLALCDLYMPQIYWHSDNPADTWVGDPVKMLRTCLGEWGPYAARYRQAQLFPTGALARYESNNDPALIAAFCAEVDCQGLAGANFWDWQEATEKTWAALAGWKARG